MSIDGSKPSERCGHALSLHTFLMADMDCCHEDECDCPWFEGEMT